MLKTEVFHSTEPPEATNWKAVRAACSPKDCYWPAKQCRNEAHPSDGCFSERAMFDLLRKRMFECIEDIAEGKWLASQVGSQDASCELHYIRNCYTCSPLAKINIFLAKRRKKLRGYVFALNGMAVKHGFKPEGLVEAQTNPEGVAAEPNRAENERPRDLLFSNSPDLKGQRDARASRKDKADNIRLLEAWIASRGE